MKTKYRKYWQFLIFILLTAMSGCEEEYSWKLKSTDIRSLVVDGIITNENKAQLIKLSKVNPVMNAPYAPVSGAVVTVWDSTDLYSFSESATVPGSYYSVPFRAVTGKNYVLKIVYQSTTYTASASMVPITPLDSIRIVKENGLYKYNHVNYGNPAMVEVYLDWSSDSSYCVQYGSCQAMEIFYILNNVDVNAAFGPEKETIYFPAGTKLVRRKYSLSDQYQAFLRSLLMETEWRGGIFDVQQGNVSSNISNGGFGFFAACMVLSDSTVVK